MIAETCLAIGLHLVSYHSAPGFNNTNPGIYCRTHDGYVFGTYRNSVRRQTVYAARYFELVERGRFDAGIVVGLATGYGRPVTPQAMGTMSYAVTAKDAVRLSFVPSFRGSAAVVHLAVEHRF